MKHRNEREQRMNPIRLKSVQMNQECEARDEHEYENEVQAGSKGARESRVPNSSH
jgi:hypothetical protein